MNEYLVKKLREGLLNINLKQSDVTKLTLIKNTTLSNYENGITEPDIDTFLQLCELYGLDYAEILGEAYGLGVVGSDFNIRPSEIDLVEMYRELDEHGRKMVNFTLLEEHDRVLEFGKLSKNNKVTHIEDTRAQYAPADAAHERMGEHSEEDRLNDENMLD